jgi:hypothetical protein
MTTRQQRRYAKRTDRPIASASPYRTVGVDEVTMPPDHLGLTLTWRNGCLTVAVPLAKLDELRAGMALNTWPNIPAHCKTEVERFAWLRHTALRCVEAGDLAP